jgi:hypothetical protein
MSSSPPSPAPVAPTAAPGPVTLAEPVAPLTDTVHVSAWPDAVIDQVGLDPRSAYVEQYWLGILGPSTTWLLRRLVTGLEDHPSGYALPVSDTARALGLGTPTGRHSPFMRSLNRLCQFRLARWQGDDLEVRRKVPPLSQHQVGRLPETLQASHRAWQEHELCTPTEEQRHTRARRLALSLLELGEDLESTERWLHRWRFHPALARQASAWAWDRHRKAVGEAGSGSDPDAGPVPA